MSLSLESPLRFPLPLLVTPSGWTSPDVLLSGQEGRQSPTHTCAPCLHTGGSPTPFTAGTPPGAQTTTHRACYSGPVCHQQGLTPELLLSTCPFPCRGCPWARGALAPPLTSGPERAFFTCADTCLLSGSSREYRCRTACGRAGLPPISRLIQTERGPCPAALFALHPLPTVREIDLGGGGGVFLLFPPISLITAGCQAALCHQAWPCSTLH